MSEFKYEIGDQFKNRLGQPRKVLFRAVAPNGTRCYMIEMEDSIDAFDESYFEGWIKIEPFFEVGDTFTSPYDHVTTMTVTHVDEELKSAWTTGTSRHEAPRRETVTTFTWDRVKAEVLRNRNA